MNDLRTRITGYVDSTVPPVDIDLLVEQLGHSEEPTRRLQPGPALGRSWTRRRWAPILVGAVAVLILIGGAALFTRRTEAPVITVPDTTTPAPTTTLPSTTTIPVAPLVGTAATGPWTNQEIVGNSVIGDDLVAGSITSGGPGFVATGNTYTGGDISGRGQIWTSTDGSSWTWVADDDRSLFVEGYWPDGVVSADAGFLVWGTNNRQGGTVIWHSSNGTDWSLATGEAHLADDYFTDGIALSGGGYLLYGVPCVFSVETDICSRPDRPRILKSSDGFAWEIVTTPVTFTAIVQTESGDLLAAQRRASEPSTWISHDEGQTWQRNGPDRSIELGQPSAKVSTIEVTPYGLIAAGVDADDQSVVWISDNGETFTPALSLPMGAGVSAIAYGRGWLVAVGHEEIPQVVQGVTSGPAMWTSGDGREWQAAPLLGTYVGGGWLNDIAYQDSVFIAVGQHRAEIGGEALVLRWEDLK